MENNVQKLIAEIIEHHKQLLWEKNVQNVTNPDEFETWCTTMAQMHAVITLKYLFTEDEFSTLQDEANESTDASAN